MSNPIQLIPINDLPKDDFLYNKWGAYPHLRIEAALFILSVLTLLGGLFVLLAGNRTLPHKANIISQLNDKGRFLSAGVPMAFGTLCLFILSVRILGEGERYERRLRRSNSMILEKIKNSVGALGEQQVLVLSGRIGNNNYHILFKNKENKIVQVVSKENTENIRDLQGFPDEPEYIATEGFIVSFQKYLKFMD